ncbi:MAG: MarR family transcriptional regulator [Hyphomicrobiales bacterium]|nr:MarR family transcriptional regulator [Hyphomicrobiales bacterium]
MALATHLDDAAEAARGDLSASAAAALLTVRHHGPLTVSELARVVGVSQPTALRVVAGLERAGWVEKADRDGRERRLALTAAGARRAVAAQDARLGAAARALAMLSPRERDLFGRLVRRILEGTVQGRAQARRTCRQCDHAVCDGASCPAGTAARRLEALAGIGEDRP